MADDEAECRWEECEWEIANRARLAQEYEDDMKVW